MVLHEYVNPVFDIQPFVTVVLLTFGTHKVPAHHLRLMIISWLCTNKPCLCPAGMDFHEDLSRLGEKEGLKGRKLNKAVESFTWNITVLKVSSAPPLPVTAELSDLLLSVSELSVSLPVCLRDRATCCEELRWRPWTP